MIPPPPVINYECSLNQIATLSKETMVIYSNAFSICRTMDSGADMREDVTKVEARWHQCPRCSFWFDCLTEPSFANRPDEVPHDEGPALVPGPIVTNIKKEILFNMPPDVSDPFGNFSGDAGGDINEVLSAARDTENEIRRKIETDQYQSDMDIDSIFKTDAFISEPKPKTKKRIRKKTKAKTEKSMEAKAKSASAKTESASSDETKKLDEEKQVEEECVECKKMLPKSNMTNHMKYVHKIFACPECPVTYKSSKGLRFHLEEHSGEAQLCTECNQLFRGRLTLRRHMKQVHTTQPWLQCDKCDKTYKTPTILRQHMEAEHSGIPRELQKTHECHVCLKKFFTKGKVKEHIASVHSTERPFRCVVLKPA